MNRIGIRKFSIPVIVLILLWLNHFSFSDSLILAIVCFCVINLISGLSYRIGILDVVCLIASLIYLLFPLLTYTYFTESNALAYKWKTFMTIDKEEYFSFALPATLLLLTGLLLPLKRVQRHGDIQLLQNVRHALYNKGYVGYMLLGLGLLCTMIVPLMPESVKAIVYFFSQLTFVGALYLLHSNISSKRTVIVFVLVILLAQVVASGMYGELIFWSLLGVIIMLVGKRNFSFLKKASLILLGIVLILLIQSVKHEYRDAVWKGAKRGNDPALLWSLVTDRLSNPGKMVEPERIYNITIRGNQGYLVARAMAYVPKREPFAHGETILSAIAASLVPRFLWKDKPRVGGQENICRFLGDCGHYNYSYNIGQLGEAYVNFGRKGGMIFMFCYGLFINWCLAKVKALSRNRPTLILWIPLLFFAALSLETDVLTFLNSFIKGCVFCWACYFSFRVFLNIRI